MSPEQPHLGAQDSSPRTRPHSQSGAAIELANVLARSSSSSVAAYGSTNPGGRVAAAWNGSGYTPSTSAIRDSVDWIATAS